MRITCSSVTDSDLRILLTTVETVSDRDVAVPAPDLVGEDELRWSRLCSTRSPNFRRSVAGVNFSHHLGDHDELCVEVPAPDESIRVALEVEFAPIIGQPAFERRGRVAVDNGHCIAISLHAHPEVLVAPAWLLGQESLHELVLSDLNPATFGNDRRVIAVGVDVDRRYRTAEEKKPDPSIYVSVWDLS
jgi:hypothetical protein